MRYCAKCGSELGVAAKFCSTCGSPVDDSSSGPEEDHAGKVFVCAADRRCHPGRMEKVADLPPDEFVHYVGDEWLDQDAPEAAAAGSAFDPLKPPAPNDWVPVDCVWAYAPHPGRARPTSGKLQQKLASIGALRGRTYSELRQHLGPPQQVINGENSIYMWQTTGFMSMYHIALLFDKYDICMGVQNEMTM